MKKLGINTAAGVLDIIASIVYFLAIFVLVGSAIEEGFTTGQLAELKQ